MMWAFDWIVDNRLLFPWASPPVVIDEMLIVYIDANKEIHPE